MSIVSRFALACLFMTLHSVGKADTVYQTLVPGETLKIEGLKNIKFTKAGRVSLGDVNLLYVKGKETKTYPVSVRLKAGDQFKTKSDSEAPKTTSLSTDPHLSIQDTGDIEFKIDRESDGTIKKVKAIMSFKLSDPQGVFQELKFESEDIKDLYLSIFNKTANGPNDKFGASLTKRALTKIFIDNLKWETVQAAAKEKAIALSTNSSTAPSQIMPANSVIQSPVDQHKAGLLRVKQQLRSLEGEKE